MADNKKYRLKPGLHQFAPGAPAVHSNDNLTDEEAEWYLEKYPHIAGLFEIDEIPTTQSAMVDELEDSNISEDISQPVKSKRNRRNPKQP